MRHTAMAGGPMHGQRLSRLRRLPLLYDIYNQLVSLQVKLIPTNKNQNYGKQGQESHPY